MASVDIGGAQSQEWQLTYDIGTLSALGITPADISSAIREHNSTAFIGIAPTQGGEWIRVAQTALHGTPAGLDLTDITVKGHRLDRLVTAVHTEGAPRSYFRINGLNSIYVNIYATEDANQLALAEAVRLSVADFAAAMPSGYMIDLSYDATESITKELDKIYYRTGLTVLILLLFVGIVSLSWRYVLLITIGLAINLAVAVVFYYFTDVELQLYSLAGITISLNLVIDNLIVMADHYTRRRDRRAFTAILAATLTTIGALAVVFFMDEKTRLSLVDFVTVVIVNLGVSLAVALFLVPALVERLHIRPRRKRRLGVRLSVFISRIYAACIRFMLRWRWAFIVLVVLGFGLPVFMLPEKMEGEGKLAKFYNTTYKETIRPVTDAALGGSLRLFVEKVYNGSYWNRDISEPVLYINATLPNGATLAQMDALVKRMEGFLSEFEQIRQFQTSISSPRRAQIAVYFRSQDARSGFPYRLKNEAVSKALTLGGGSWSVYGLENDQGFNNDVRESAGSYRVKLTGYNYDELARWADVLADTLLTHKRIKEVTIGSEFSWYKDDYTEFYLDIDPQALASRGLTLAQLYAAIQPTFGRGIACGSIDGERITLSSLQGGQYDIYSLMNRPFAAGNSTIKLSEIGQLAKRKAPQSVRKENQQYVMTLQYEYIGSQKGGDRVLKHDLEVVNSMMPTGYRAESEQLTWGRDDDTGKYWLLGLILAIIFVTTAILFNSLRRPLIIMFTIPVSFIGVFLTFYLFKLNFDQGGFASMVLLCGITVNAAIYLMNEFDGRRAGHSPTLRAYIKSFQTKIVPIMLTVLSTILGFIPLMVGDTREGFWFPLACGVIGGLAFSLLAVVVHLPLLLLPRRTQR